MSRGKKMVFSSSGSFADGSCRTSYKAMTASDTFQRTFCFPGITFSFTGKKFHTLRLQPKAFRRPFNSTGESKHMCCPVFSFYRWISNSTGRKFYNHGTRFFFPGTTVYNRGTTSNGFRTLSNNCYRASDGSRTSSDDRCKSFLTLGVSSNKFGTSFHNVLSSSVAFRMTSNG
jgi:hypothetical protein